MRDRLVLAGTAIVIALVALSSGRRRKRARAAAAGGAVIAARQRGTGGDTDPLRGLRAADLFDPMLEHPGALRPAPAPAKPVVEGGRVTGHYLDKRSDTHLHRGVDIAAPAGSPVRAIAPGKVIETALDGERSGYGNAVLIEHEDGTASFYAHLQGFTVNAGDTVLAGDVIGYVGQTQAPRPPMKMKPHLHLEIFESINRGGGGRAIIHEHSPERFDPELYAELVQTPLAGKG